MALWASTAEPAKKVPEPPPSLSDLSDADMDSLRDGDPYGMSEAGFSVILKMARIRIKRDPKFKGKNERALAVEMIRAYPIEEERRRQKQAAVDAERKKIESEMVSLELAKIQAISDYSKEYRQNQQREYLINALRGFNQWSAPANPYLQPTYRTNCHSYYDGDWSCRTTTGY